MEGKHVVGWLFATFLILGMVRGQERVDGGEKLAQEARQLAEAGKHAEAARRWADAAGAWARAGKKAEAARAWSSASWEHEEAADFASALSAAESALRAMRELHADHDDAELAKAIDRTGYLLAQRLDRPAEGLPRFEAALAMRRRLFAGDHPDVGESLNSVAWCLDLLGRTTEALPLFEAALAMTRRLFPGDHPLAARSLNNMACCLESLGRTTEALPRFEAALAMRRRLFSDDHSDVAVSLNDLARCLQSLGRSKEALTRTEEALAISKRLFSGDHPNVVVSLNNLASCLQSLGRSDEAMTRTEEALAISKRLFPENHPYVARSGENLASCLQSLGRTKEALTRFEEVLAMRRHLFPGDHPDVARALDNVAFCVGSLGRTTEALPLFEAALAMRKRLFTGDHQDVASSLHNVAACLLSLGRNTEALPRYQEALAMRKRLFAADQPLVAQSLSNLGSCLDSLGRTTEALPMHAEALAMNRRLFPGDQPKVAQSLDDVASCLGSLGRPPEALSHYQEALAMSKRLFPGDHPYVVRSLDNVALCLYVLGRITEAFPLYDQALAMRQRLFPDEPPAGQPIGVRWVVSVGIDAYKDPLLGRQFATADARSVAKLFGETDAKFVRTEARLLLDGQATRAGIERVLREVAANARPADTLVFYFSGQAREGFQGAYGLLPQDATPDATSHITGEMLASWISRIQARNQIVVLDSCATAPALRTLFERMADEDGGFGRFTGKRRLVIGIDGFSFESATLRHGLVTAALLEILGGEADVDGDGTVTACELEVTLPRAVLSLPLKPDFEKSESRFPRQPQRVRSSSFGADFPILRCRPVEKPAEPPAGNRGIAANDSALESRPSPALGARRDYALLFATDNYNDPKWPRLANPIADARALKQVLTDSFGFVVELVEDPSGSDVVKKLGEYRQRSFGELDQLLVFFAGHGMYNQTVDRGYVIARDSGGGDLPERAITHDMIRDACNLLPVRHVLLVLDVCFGGSIGNRVLAVPTVQDGAGAGNPLERLLRHRSRFYLTSGGREYVSDGGPKKHSPFAARVLEALTLPKSPLQYEDLIAHVKLMPAAEQGPAHGPFGDYDPQGGFVFVRAPKSGR